MNTLETAVPHRLGRRVSFIPAMDVRPASWSDVIDAASDSAQCNEVAESALATTLTRGAANEPVVSTVNVEGLRVFRPDDLFAVRRPASHKGMTNYLSRVVVPNELEGARSVWCESFNEQEHLRDLLLDRQPSQVSTQFARLEWVFKSGVRTHIPDFLLRWDNRNAVVDISTESKVEDPRLLAILRLTRATCEAIGWSFQLRTELPPQRVCNVNFLRAGAHDIRQDRMSAARSLRQAIGGLDVQRAAQILGGGPSGYARLWDLISHACVFIDLDRPIERDTSIRFTRQEGVTPWLRAL